jgi:hypothetical protein
MVVEHGRRSTPIHATVPLVVVTSLTTTENSFGILDNAAAMTYNNVLYKAVRVSQPDVATILCRQEQSIQGLMTNGRALYGHSNYNRMNSSPASSTPCLPRSKHR